MEFKKFMYLTATEILRRRREGQLDLKKNSRINKKWFFEAPYAAPPYIDRVWRLLILYNKNYENFCEKIWGGFIERVDPRENFQTNYFKYTQAISSLELKKDFVKPFHNLWPRYKTADEYSIDLEYNCYISSEGIPLIVQYMNKHWVEAGSQEIQIITCKNLANQWKKYHTVSSPPIGRKINVAKDSKVIHPYFKARAQTPLQILDKSLKLLFPARFMEILMNEQMIDINTANKWVLEYRKFLTMAYLTDYMISPSEQVDQVWHLHMTYTHHYRATWKTLIEKEFKHSPSEGGSSEGQKFEDIYEDTLSFYESVFTINPPADIWESTQQRFDMKNFSYRTVNLYRLAVATK